MSYQRTIDCPDCAGEVPFGTNTLTCPKCGSQFRERALVYVKPHEFRNPLVYARAHLKAADKLMGSIENA